MGTFKPLLMVGTLALAGASAQAAIDGYKVQDASGRQVSAEVQGDRLYLLDKGKRSLAPDGIYKMDGSVREMRGGMLVPAVRGANPVPGYAVGDSSAHSNKPARQGVGAK